jgi:uncharacterized SAM-binding protein YcdF (DUF218 family)
VATWLVIGALGIPAVLGLGAVGDLPWIALFGAALGALRLLGLIWFLLGVGVMALLAVSFFPLLDNRIDGMVRADDPVRSRVDAVVVLSASLTSEGRLGRVAQERLNSGMLLRPELGTRHLVLTKVLRPDRAQMAAAEAHQRQLVARLDPAAELHLVGPTSDTHDEALATETLARNMGWKRVAVVTSALHSRRACATFEARGLQVMCRPSEPRRLGLSLRRAPEDRLEAFREWLYEVAGTVVYRRRGWLSGPAKRNVQARLRRIHDASAPRSVTRNSSACDPALTDNRCRSLEVFWGDRPTRFRQTT